MASGYYKILKNLSKPHWFEIIRLVKCSEGLSVGELAEAMGMSYMGVKKHCVALQKLGYLDTWRRPKDVGRPEKSYRVTRRIDPLFPQIGNEVSLAILRAAAQLDVNAAEKILFAFFKDQTDRYAKKISGDSVQERAERLAEARDAEGYFSQCIYSEEEGLRIDEYHNPLQPLFEQYHTLARMEEQMFEKLLGALVTRDFRQVSGLTRYRFQLRPRR